MAIVYAAINGYLDSVEVSKVAEYEARLSAKLENQYGAWLERIENGYFEDSDIEELKKILSEVQG